MNIETTVASWIASQTTLTTGTDLFLGNLFNTTKEGTCVLLNRNLLATGNLSRALLQILFYYRDYVVGRNLVQTIIELFNNYRGTDTWSTSGTVSSEYIGIDELNRNIFSISVEIAYKEA